jgi:hypothetical protein
MTDGATGDSMYESRLISDFGTGWWQEDDQRHDGLIDTRPCLWERQTPYIRYIRGHAPILTPRWGRTSVDTPNSPSSDSRETLASELADFGYMGNLHMRPVLDRIDEEDEALGDLSDDQTSGGYRKPTPPAHEYFLTFPYEATSDDDVRDDCDDDDDAGLLLFPDDPRYIDVGWGHECLQDTEDIDFEFVYALHTFVATVEGQANATKGDNMVLLDDSNSYWWLVKVVKDSSIGAYTLWAPPPSSLLLVNDHHPNPIFSQDISQPNISKHQLRDLRG